MKRSWLTLGIIACIAAMEAIPYLPTAHVEPAARASSFAPSDDLAGLRLAGRLNRLAPPPPAPARAATPPAPARPARHLAARARRRAPSQPAARSDLASMIAAARRSNGLGALRWNATLSGGARAHSSAMASRGSLYHSGDGELFANARRACSCSTAGEVVGVGSSLRAVFRSFMADPAHRRVIFDRRFRYGGVGVVFSHGSYWVTVRFAG